MKYHVNPEIGTPTECKAKGVEAGGKDCKFVHGDTPEQAVKALEKVLNDVTVVSLTKAREMTDETTEASTTSHELRKAADEAILNMPLKNLNTSHLIQDINARAERHGLDQEQVSSAISLASILHASQIRQVRGKFKIVPYIEHPLRNTSRLLRLGVIDQDVAIASLLHDAVEDGSVSFMNVFYNEKVKDSEEVREKLSQYIEQAYGKNVADIVSRVTNKFETKEESNAKTVEQKHADYAEKVEKGITGHKGAFLVKISDFLDNAGSLQHQIGGSSPEVVARFKRTAKKYKPMINVFLKAMNTIDLEEGAVPSDRGNQKVSSYLKSRLHQIDKSLDEIIAA